MCGLLSNIQLIPTQYSLTRVSPPRREPPQSFRRRGSLGKSKDELREIFNEFDEDKDGFFILDEFYNAMCGMIAKGMLPDIQSLTKDESDEIFLDCDKDDDGLVSFAEFFEAMGGADDVAEGDFTVEEPGADDDDDE